MIEYDYETWQFMQYAILAEPCDSEQANDDESNQRRTRRLESRIYESHYYDCHRSSTNGDGHKTSWNESISKCRRYEMK